MEFPWKSITILEPYGFVWKCWVYSQWNSHLIGIMISKTSGFRGLAYFQTNPYILVSDHPYINGKSPFLMGKSTISMALWVLCFVGAGLCRLESPPKNPPRLDLEGTKTVDVVDERLAEVTLVLLQRRSFDRLPLWPVDIFCISQPYNADYNVIYIHIYICFSGNQSWLLHRSSLFMSPRAFLALAIEGVRSNFWGLGCPAYCASPSLGLLGFCLLLGWLLGLLSAVLLLVWISGPGAPLLDFLRCPVHTFRGSSQTSTDSRSQVLAAYVHEPGAHLPRRRRWIAHWPAW